MHQQMMMSGSQESATTIFVSRKSIASLVIIILLGISLQLFAPGFVEEIQEKYWIHAFVVGILFAMFFPAAISFFFSDSEKEDFPKMFIPRPFAFEELSWYDGARNSTANRKLVEQKRKNNTTNSEKQQQHPLPLYDNLVFVAVKGVIYNVDPSYYGAEAGYRAFAAKDASRHLGKVVVGTEEANCDWTSLSEKHIEVLGSWEDRFRSKYSIVGWVVPDLPGYHERAAKFDP